MGRTQQHLGAVCELGDRLRLCAHGVRILGQGNPGGQDDFPHQRQHARGRCGNRGEELGDLRPTGGIGGPFDEPDEIPQSRLPVPVRRGQGVQGGVEVDAVAGGEEGVRGGRGLETLLLGGQAMGQTVLFTARAGVVDEAGPLEDVRHLLGAADGHDQPGAGVFGEGDVLQHPEVGLLAVHRALVTGVRGVTAGVGGVAAGVVVGTARAAGCWRVVAMPSASSCGPIARTARACAVVSSPLRR